jgi:hypothetical protein
VVDIAPAIAPVEIAVAVVAVCENANQFVVPAAAYVTVVPPHNPVGELLMPIPNVAE